MVAVMMPVVGGSGVVMGIMVCAALAACLPVFASIGGAVPVSRLTRLLTAVGFAVVLAVVVFELHPMATVITDPCLELGLPQWLCWFGL